MIDSSTAMAIRVPRDVASNSNTRKVIDPSPGGRVGKSTEDLIARILSVDECCAF